MKSLEKNQDLAKEGNLLKQLLDHERYLWFSKINKYTLLILWLGLLEQMKQKRRKPYSSRMRKKALDILGGLLTPNIKYQVKEKFKAKLAWTIHSPSQTILSHHQDHWIWNQCLKSKPENSRNRARCAKRTCSTKIFLDSCSLSILEDPMHSRSESFDPFSQR